MKNGIITVKEWFFDKVNDSCKNYGCMLNGEYEDVDGVTMLDHTKLRVSEVLCETEKAYKVMLDAETFNGHYKAWTTWIPKSVIC
jgi:hypothetical protein